MRRAVCVFGDSIAAGKSDFESGGWVQRIQSSFGAHNTDIKLYNLGISGDTTENLLVRFEVEARVRTPEAIIFAIGINDSRYRGSRSQPCVSREQFIANLGQLLSLAAVLTPRIGFVGLTNVDETKTKPIPWKPEWFYDSETAAIYNGLLRDFCTQHQAQFFDVYNLIPLVNFPDGLHPDTHGHALLAQALEPWIVQLVNN